MAEMTLLHWDLINTSYPPDVVEGWRSGGCFDQISCRIGHRFVLLYHESPGQVRWGTWDGATGTNELDAVVTVGPWR